VVETQRQSVLVVGSDALSTGFNWHDRNAVLFGDGAGAVVLSPSEKPGILAIEIGAEYSDGITLKTPLDSTLSSPLNYLAGEHERRAGDWYTKMNGRAIMKLSLTHVPKAIDNVMQRAGSAAADIDHFYRTRQISTLSKNLPATSALMCERYPTCFRNMAHCRRP
jgi:3-oxoacyl-[acyl-carrier-protein] synthase-3